MLQKLSLNTIKLACTTALITGAIIAVPTEKAMAAGSQVFSSLTYINPAELDYVENFKATIGSGLLNVKMKFNGSQSRVANNPRTMVPGRSHSNRNKFIPYGQIIYRIESLKRLCIGFDVSNPQFGNFSFQNGPLNGIKTTLYSRNYSGKASFKVTDPFTIGVGVDVLYNSHANVNFPIAPGIQLENKTHGSKFGWDAGFLWKVLPTSHVSGSYHSRMFLNSNGYSTLITPIGNNVTFTSMNANLPDTFTLNYLQILSQKFLVNFAGRYMLWKKAYKNFIIRNSALQPPGTLVFPLNYKNSWMGQVFTRYQFAEKWAGIGFVEFDSNPQPKAFRPINYPADKLWFFGLGLQFMPTKNWETQFIYGFAYSNPSFNNVNTIGKEKIRVNLFDLRCTYKF